MRVKMLRTRTYSGTTYQSNRDYDVSDVDGQALIDAGWAVRYLPAAEVVSVVASRTLTAADDGRVLDCTEDDLTLTVPAGLPEGFGCLVIPAGTTSIASSGGALINGATDTLTRDDSLNVSVAIVGRATADSYVVTGD